MQTCGVLLRMLWPAKKFAIWYGGARPGNIGGPLVKVKRLIQFFPQEYLGFSHVYLLSNTPYLSKIALRFLKYKKIPIILNQNGVYYGAWYDGNWEAKNREMANAWHSADYVFCQSEFCFLCAEKYLGQRNGRTEILFNAVDINRFRPRDFKENCNSIVFLLTGKIDNHLYYRLDITLRSFALARSQGLNGILKISGWIAEDARRQMADLIKELGVEDYVICTGAYSQEDAPVIYQSADVYVMLKHNDPCPNTVLEAMACGLPVLYSKSGGVPELVTPTAGIGVDVRQSFEEVCIPEVEDIARGMLDICEDLEARGRAARARAVEAFNLNNWINRHREVFEELARN